MKAGWISGIAHNERGLIIEWTEPGGGATKQFRTIFDQLGDPMSAIELAAFLSILDTMSPGGTSEAESARIK